MASITRDQIKKINSGCANGFELDIQHAILWGEKQLEKDIFVNDNTKITFTLYYARDYKNNSYTPALKADKWIKSNISENVWSSYSTGKKIDIKPDPESVKRRNINILQKLTNNLNDELLKGYIIELYGDLSEEGNQMKELIY